MLKSKEICILSFAAVLGWSQASQAGTSASFLKLGSDARALGLGSAYTAVTQDSSALFWNPAGLARLKSKEVSATHAALYSDVQYDIVSYGQSIKNNAIGIGAFYLNQGELEGRSELGTKTQDFSASDLALTVGLARKVSGNLNLGLNAKWIESKINQESSRALAFDLGAQSSTPNSKFRTGFAILNLGQKMKFEKEPENLPLSVSGGVAYSGFKFMLVSADIKQEIFDSKTIFSLGTEFSVGPWASLRAGYLSHGISARNAQGKFGSDNFASLSGLGLGMGLKIGPGRIDYAVSPAGELGSSHRISLAVLF